MQQRKKTAASPPLAVAAEAAVLGNDDLLREILVRLDYPTSLVHAALVCKRWLRHASDPAFLRRFRGLHPPRLLGLYIIALDRTSRFVPLPHPRELDVMFRRTSMESVNEFIVDCRNGRLLMLRLETAQMRNGDQLFVCDPLHQTPEFHAFQSIEVGGNYFLLLDGSNDMSYCVVKLMCAGTKISMKYFVVQDGARSEVRTSTTIEPSFKGRFHVNSVLFVNNKFYLLGDVAAGIGYILGLDLTSMILCVINLPDGVQQHEEMRNIVLSHADGSGFYLVYLKGFQIHVWHRDDKDDTSEWKFIDTICVREAIAHLASSDFWVYALEEGSILVRLDRVGDNAEFLLDLGHEVFHVYIRSRKVVKVFERTPDENSWFLPSVIHPFTTVWPPCFPALSKEQVHQDQDE